MPTELRFEVTVHLDFDDPELNDMSVPRDQRVQNNVTNIAETIESVVFDEYGFPYVDVSAQFVADKEELSTEEFAVKLAELSRDAIKEGRTHEEFNLEGLFKAFAAIREHALQGDLFEHTSVPTDDALLQIFSFVTLP